MRRTPFQAKPQPKSDQPHSPERGMPVASDNDVIMDGDAQRLGDCDNVQCHLDVLGRGRRIARRVIVNKHDRRRRQFQRAAHHLARIDRGVVDGARALNLVGDQAVLLVEILYAGDIVILSMASYSSSGDN